MSWTKWNLSSMIQLIVCNIKGSEKKTSVLQLSPCATYWFCTLKGKFATLQRYAIKVNHPVFPFIIILLSQMNRQTKWTACYFYANPPKNSQDIHWTHAVSHQVWALQPNSLWNPTWYDKRPWSPTREERNQWHRRKDTQILTIFYRKRTNDIRIRRKSIWYCHYNSINILRLEREKKKRMMLIFTTTLWSFYLSKLGILCIL